MCSGETLCAGFKGSYFDEYSSHASEPQRLAAANNMVQTVQMARPIDPDLLADDATVTRASMATSRFSPPSWAVARRFEQTPNHPEIDPISRS